MGFTLIEVVVYIGLFGVLMSGAVVTVYALLSGIHDNRNEIALYGEAQFINNKLGWALAGASKVMLISSTTFEIERLDLGEDSPLTFSIQENQFFLKRGTHQDVLLSSNDFLVSDINITMHEHSALNRTEVIIKYFINGVPIVYRTFI